jgi:site-specific DNA-methyltransferase (adenine-specific)
MILADLPYGTTACKWDTIIPFEPLWARFKRIIKPRGAIVLTASQPFTSALVMSNPAWFRYEWVWDKKYHANPFLAKRQPLRITETVLVFSNGGEFYYPQMRKRPDKWMRENPSFEHKNGAIFGKQGKKHPNSSTREWMYPSNILDFPLEPPISRTTHHPTQKPVALFEYLIKTYTQAGELVFDPVVGSGTTAVACVNTGRRFICGDQSAEYVAIARERVRKAQTEARQMELIA